MGRLCPSGGFARQQQHVQGFGRCGHRHGFRATRFWFDTVKAGQGDAEQAPHLNVIVSMRGMLLHAFTRSYFPDEPANATDKVL